MSDAEPRITDAWLERAEAQMVSGDLSGMFVNRDDVLALVRECRRLLRAALSSPETTPSGGTTTDCPLEGVHEHAFRGPHRFHEWDPADYKSGTPTPAGVLPGGHSLFLEAMEWIAIVAVTGAKAEDAERWLREHDDGRGDWDFSPAGVLDEAWAVAEKALPEGMSLVRLDHVPLLREKFGAEPYRAHAEWWTGSGSTSDLNRADSDGPTPAAALQALAAALGRSGSGGGRG